MAPILGQRNTADGWRIPLPSNPRSPKEEGKSSAKVEYDYGFMAYGEDIVSLYNQQYDKNCPVICIQKRALDIQNLSENAWVGNLRAESKPKKQKLGEGNQKEDNVEAPSKKTEEQDSRLGITLAYNPHTGQKWFHINDWADDLSWAVAMKDIVDKMYPDAEKIHIVLCKEAQEKIGALEHLFKADEALRIYLKLKIHIVPDSARWLNFAENEIITVARQCIKDQVSEVKQVTDHLVNWQKKRNFVKFNLSVSGFRQSFSSVYKN